MNYQFVRIFIICCLCLYPFIGFSKSSEETGNTEKQAGNQMDFNNLDLSLISSEASFEAGEINLEEWKYTYTGNMEGNWRIDIWFSICELRDKTSEDFLIGNEFLIVSELKDDDILGIASWVSTDNCLKWKQEIPFFDPVNSVNLVIHYEIQRRWNKGKIVRRVGLNPYLSVIYNERIYDDSDPFPGFFMDMTFLNRKDWATGEWATGKENIIAALKGKPFTSVKGGCIPEFRDDPTCPARPDLTIIDADETDNADLANHPWVQGNNFRKRRLKWLRPDHAWLQGSNSQ